MDDVDAEFFDRMMRTNVRGPVLQLARLAGQLRDGASVVVTSSTSTYEGSPMATVYAATEGALVAAVRGGAAELADRGTRVNTLVPGAIDTAFRGFMPGELRADFESDEASCVTASRYFLDGGLTRT